MPLDPKRLRRWFAAVVILVIAISLAYYLYARLHLWRVVERGPDKMGVEVQQSTQGFTLSKSAAGRTIFTVHASKAVQYKEGGRAELHDVSILVYGRRSDRFDQIQGKSFEYDPKSGDIIARGEVAIDLEGDAQGPVRPDQATPGELKNPIHLETSGLVFNQMTGSAATRERVEFRAPQASGSAVGASYDSKSNTLTLDSELQVETLEGTRIRAQRAIITQNPRRVVLDAAHIERPTSDVQTGQLTLYLRDDNSISRMLAAGEVRGIRSGPNQARVEAAQGEFTLGSKNEIQSGELSGGVKFQEDGTLSFHGTAGRATLAFGPGKVLTRLKAAGAVEFIEDQRATASQSAQSLQLASDTLDLFLAAGRLERGITGGSAAKITVRPQAPSKHGDTVVTAGRFEMKFGVDNRLSALHGEPDARIVSSAPGQADKVSTSQKLDLAFDAKGDITTVAQQGNVRYNDAQRSAFADQARYTPADENLVLTGSPRWSEAGGTTTARVLKLNQRSGAAFAEGEVKTTYRETRSQPSGGLLSGSEPIHVTADKMNASRQSGSATFSGSARLWQRTNIVEAPLIEFSRDNRVLTAEGGRQQPATLVLVESDSKGKATPVTVTASSMTYSDPQRRAVLRGGVLLRSSEGTISADDAEIFFGQRNQKSRDKSNFSTNQIDAIVAQGHVVAQQPSRKVVGDKLTYTASEGKYVMAGGRPSIFDAEHGVTSGDSLTFYSRSDTVLVGSETSTRTVTQTHTGR
jgi:lipopolysaccharide export system protein LptA